MKKEFFPQLEKLIASYDKIFFIHSTSCEILPVLNEYSKERKKIFFLLEKVTHNQPDCIEYLILNEKSSAALLRLYKTYEFSNKFIVLSTDSNFGTIWNYVKTGLMTPKEALAALLD